MPKKFEREVKARGGASRWRNMPIKGHPDEYMKVAVTPGAGPRGGHTVAYKKHKKKTESQERIQAWFGRGPLFERGAHKAGCPCGWCRNKGHIADHWKKKLDDASKGKKDEEEEPKDMTEGLDDALKAVLGEEKHEGLVKLSKGSTIGKANAAYTNMTSKQQDKPGFKPRAYIKAEAELTNQTSRMGGFKNKGEGETTTGAALPKKRPGESAQRVAASLLDG